jgi:DNA-binding FadR family transcriptional regulator
MVTEDQIEADGAAGRRGAAERGKLHVPVVEAFEQQILSGRLKIGDRMPAEAEIARLYNVSTRSVREALQILETKGLVRRKHGERALVVRDDVGEFLGSLAVTVKQLFANNSDYLVQLMDVRRIIETEVVTRLSSEDLTIAHEVDKALAEMRAAARAGDISRFTDSDAAFHLGLVRSVGNEILNVVYDNLFGIIIDVIRVTSRVPDKSLEAGLAEHEEIHRLIVARQADAARAAIRRQIDNSSSYLKVALDNANLKNRATTK